jgi:thiosulfate dehydrogenase [quinone] large subunit
MASFLLDEAIMTVTTDAPRDPAQFREPPFARWLFASSTAAWIWLPIRLYLGYEWITAGWGKLFGEGAVAWTGANAGAAVTGFAQGALQLTGGEHPDVTPWYGWFLENVTIPNAALFSWLVTLGEIAVGIALILGALTGIAAFFGIMMNANYLLAGTVSSNPVLIILGTLLVLAWRNAGWIGLDRWLLPAIGTPWQPGGVFRDRNAATDT